MTRPGSRVDPQQPPAVVVVGPQRAGARCDRLRLPADAHAREYAPVAGCDPEHLAGACVGGPHRTEAGGEMAAAAGQTDPRDEIQAGLVGW